MKYILKAALDRQESQDVYRLLSDADREFIPPLSARTDTTQQQLSPADSRPDGVSAYYTQMMTQSFILAVNKGRVAGFLSFIPDHALTVGGETLICDYVSTIVVEPDLRNRGITRNMYRTLFEQRSSKRYATRTWSTNYAHIHLLGKLGFRLAETLTDDRGPGIDTVYYVKEDGQQ